MQRRTFLKGAATGLISPMVPFPDDSELQANFDEFEITADVCKLSFYDFVREFWDTVIAEAPIWNWHIEYICHELQIVAERVFKWMPKEYDLVINVSPGSTKSTVCSIMFPAWVWTRMPSARVIGGSYSADLAMDLSRRNRDVCLSEKYQRIFPEIQFRQDQAAKSYFMNTAGGSRFSFGVQGTVTGLHSHFILVDDPLNPNEAVSEAELKNANRCISETLTTRKVDKLVTPTILIMQRLHQDDPTQNMIDRATSPSRIRHICLPAIETKKVKPLKLKARYINGLMDPKRLPLEVLEENRAALGEFGYAGQFLQDPIPLGGGMFKTDRIRLDQKPTKWKDRVRYWDKAGTLGGGAYTVGALLGKDLNDRFWILDIVRGQWDSSRREAIIKSTAEIDGQKVRIGIEQEPGSSGVESAENTVRNLAGYRVIVDRPTGDKALRADPFSVQVNNNNVRMVVGPWNVELITELMYFPYSKYKDQADALSGAFKIISKPRRRVGAWGRK